MVALQQSRYPADFLNLGAQYVPIPAFPPRITLASGETFASTREHAIGAVSLRVQLRDW